MPTIVIDNFTGRLTRSTNGSLNSGLAKYAETFGTDPFSNPGNLTWMGVPLLIDQPASVLTDLIMAMKPRLESGQLFVYAIGHTGRLYKIQVNKTSITQPAYNNISLLTTLIQNSPTFKYGVSIQFFGATEKLFIGHDLGVTKVNFDGTGESFIGSPGSYTANVPRPSANFLGKLEFGNGANLVEIDSTETVTTYARLSPAFPAGTFTRDLDVSPDGTYLQAIVSRNNGPDMTTTVQDTNPVASTDAYKFLWNGTDVGYTSFETYTGFSMTSNTSFGSNSFTAGYDIGGTALYFGGDKIASLPNSLSPNFGAMFSVGNLMGFAAPDYDPNAGNLTGSIFVYGQYDPEIPNGLFRVMRNSGYAPDDITNIIQMPAALAVSNLFYGSSNSGYSENQVGRAQIFFSSLEVEANNTPHYRLYYFNFVPIYNGQSSFIQAGTYETQSELFSKKVKATEIRLYTEPLTDSAQTFNIQLIGSNGTITGTSTDFAVDVNVVSGQDYIKYTPQMEPTYAIGVQINNTGVVNWVAVKMEIDYQEWGSI